MLLLFLLFLPSMVTVCCSIHCIHCWHDLCCIHSFSVWSFWPVVWWYLMEFSDLVMLMTLVFFWYIVTMSILTIPLLHSTIIIPISWWCCIVTSCLHSICPDTMEEFVSILFYIYDVAIRWYGWCSLHWRLLTVWLLFYYFSVYCIIFWYCCGDAQYCHYTLSYSIPRCLYSSWYVLLCYLLMLFLFIV